jgi:hypothetical protein
MAIEFTQGKPCYIWPTLEMEFRKTEVEIAIFVFKKQVYFANLENEYDNVIPLLVAGQSAYVPL